MPYFTTHGLAYAESTRPSSLPMPMVIEPLGPPRWEYHTITLDPREEEPLDASALNALGQEGWLLAGMLPPTESVRRGRLTYYFVRVAA